MTLPPPPSERSIEDRLAFGVLNLDKPPGPTSHQVVTWVTDHLGIERGGHAGTLDPKVTGCLPILLGRGTRVAQAFLEGTKEYVAVLECHGPVPDGIEDILETFVGPIYQRPPRKSAVTRRLRTRRIHEIELLERHGRRCLLRIRCEPGTYIRKLCHDIGLVAGTGAHMGSLRRIGTTPFDDTDLVTMHAVADAAAFAEEGENRRLDAILSPAERALEHLPAVTIAPSAAETVARGSPVYAPGIIEAPSLDPADTPLVVCYTPAGSAICLGRLVGPPDADSGEAVSLERVLVA